MAVMRNICRLWLLLSLLGFSLVSLRRRGGSSYRSSSAGSLSSKGKGSSSYRNSSAGYLSSKGKGSSSYRNSYGGSRLSDNPQLQNGGDEPPTGCRVVTTSYFEDTTVTGYYGDSVILPCHCEDLEIKPQKLRWRKRFLQSGEYYGLVYNFTENSTEPGVHEDYEGRVTVVEGSPGNLSLIIKDLREEDEGSYRCESDYGEDIVKLIIKDCDLAKPGKRVEISKLSGESVLLPCWCAEEKGKPKKLTWLDPNGRLIKSYTELSGRFAPRIKMFNDLEIWNMSLLLSDLTVDDEGEYTCQTTDKKVVISLTVTDCTLSDQNGVVEVEVSQGSSILLPCTCTHLQTKPKAFRWTAPNGREIHWHYKGRSQMFHQTSSPGNLSLLLSDLMPEDEGVYRCEIGEGKSRVFVLTVNAGATHAKLTSETEETEVAVLESPCRLQHLLMFMLAALILLLITHITVGAMIIRWRNQDTASRPCN